MGKTPIKHTLAGYIIKKTDTEGYRSGKLTGEKHFNKITEMMEFVGGRRKLIDQARFIENNTQAGHDGKIRISWIQVNSDIKKIDCDVSSIPELCRLEGVEDSRAKQLRLIESVKQWKSEVGDCDWICRYYDDILGRLEAGKSVTEAEEDMRFKCINAITRIKEPVWERVFSAKVFKDSKKFEKCYRQKMVSILTKYSPYYEKDMEDYDTEGEEDECEQLMYALILSGLAMQMIGNSRPASCAEHQVTHLWDMEVINGPLDALHGEKVSVAALLVLEEYKRIATAITQGRCHVKPYENEDEELLKETFGKKGLLEEIRKENEPELLETISPQHLEKCLNGIEEIIDELPSEQTMFRLLEKAGCAKTVYDIGLDESAVLPSLRLAPYTRRRLSLLRISKMLDIRGE